MVAKIMSGRNIAGALNYNERKVNQGRMPFIGYGIMLRNLRSRLKRNF